MVDPELTPGELVVFARGQIEMAKFIKFMFFFIAVAISFSAYTSYANTKLGDSYVTTKQYKEDKKEAKDNRKEDRADMKKILKSVQDIQLDMSFIKGAKSAGGNGKKGGK